MGPVTNLQHVLAVLLLVLLSSCNAYFSGDNVSPSNNPTVSKYHSSEDINSHDYLEKSVTLHIIPGVVIGGLLFAFCALYFSYRFCRAFFCCCFKCCRPIEPDDGIFYKRRGRGRRYDDKLKNRQRVTHPVVSWCLRVLLVILFLGVGGAIAVGFLASSDYHSGVTDSLSTVYQKAIDVNNTIYDVTSIMNSLTNVTAKIPSDTLHDILQTAGDIVSSATDLNTQGPKYDTIRHTGTVALYIVVSIPVILGLIAAIMGKGKYAFYMAVLLPFGILIIWLMYAIHFSVFTVNVDACYAVDEFMISPDANTTDGNPVGFLLPCTNYTLVDSIITSINKATNETQSALIAANSTSDRNETLVNILKNQINVLSQARADMNSLIGCAAVTSLVNNVYQDLCGTLVQASLYLWQSQIGLGVVLSVAFLLGLFSEYRIGRKRGEEGFSPLLSLNE